jgi:hypothetical protein
MMNLLGLALIIAALIQHLIGSSGLMTMITGVLIVIGLTALRSAHMSRQSMNLRSIAENSIVALTYNFGRALALVASVSHKARRS